MVVSACRVSSPAWLINDRKTSRLVWLLEEKLLPPIYWQAMLKGRELLAKPHHKT